MIFPERWYQHLQQHLPIAREGTNPEGVHQLRVATRRLDTFLYLAGFRVLRSDLRWLRGKASVVRDMDVLLADDQPEIFRTWLETQGTAARVGLAEALDSDRCRGLTQSLALIPGLDEKVAGHRLSKVLRNVLSIARQMDSRPGDFELMHLLRRRLKRLRYAADWLGCKSDALKRLQNVFGRVNDFKVTLDYLESCPDHKELSPTKTMLENQLKTCATDAVSQWQDAREPLQKELAQWNSI